MEIVKESKSRTAQMDEEKLKEQQKQERDFCQLRKVMLKLSISDQLLLYRKNQDVQQVCDNIWRNAHKRLDFRHVEHEVTGESLSYFLHKMMDHFRYVYFTSDRLQENLNLLERAGVNALSNVVHCELLMPPKKQSPSIHYIQSSAGGDSEVDRTFGTASVPQWPLHALPKMLCNLRRLKVHCEVQVHFIEHFSRLELLVLYADVTQSALTGILKCCKQLRRLFIKCQNSSPSLQDIVGCRYLQDISLPLTIYHMARSQILPLPALHMLELSGGRQIPQLTIDCLQHLLSTKSNDVEIIQMNCACFDGPYWMRDVGLTRCGRLQGLVLHNCCFNDREIEDLNMPRVESYLVLSGCLDLKEYQLLDILKKCPTISELYLIDCPQITGTVLYGTYRIRCSEKLDYPIKIILSRCDTIDRDYRKSVSIPNQPVRLISFCAIQYADYWQFKLHILRVDRLLDESQQIEDLQIYFYKNKTSS